MRVKTDRSDARNLARLHRAGEFVAVRVPTPTEEAVRDLVRTREDLKSDRRTARQRIRSFLLRYGKRYPAAGARWSFRFEVWMRALRFEEPAAQAAFDHLLGAYFVRDSQLAAVDRQIEELAVLELLAESVARLRAFRGTDTLTAITIATETCDFRRFPSASSYMAFTGLTPSEDSSGASTRHGGITKTGNRHVRRVLVEAAWAYRYAPAVRGAHAKRLEGRSPEVAAYSWAAQCRLAATYRKLAVKKGPNKAVVAVARELAGRMLRPLHEITSTARRLSASTLTERIDLRGPPDELKELADTFDAMLGRLDSAFSAQREFVANASHELRTPLAIIRTELDVTMSDPDASAEDLRDMAAAIREAVDRSDQLIDRLLVLARSGGSLLRERVDLATIATECTQRYAVEADAKELGLELRLEPAVAVGDPVGPRLPALPSRA